MWTKRRYLRRLFQDKKYQKLKEISTIASNLFHELSEDSAIAYSTTTDSPSEQNSWFSAPLLSPPCSTLVKHGPCIERAWKKFQHFQQAKFQQILNIKWQDWHTNKEVLDRSETPNIEATILKHHLRWLGEVTRIVPSRLLQTILYSKLISSKWDHGSPKCRFNDQLKYFIVQAGISLNLGNRSHQFSIQAMSNSFRLFHWGKGKDGRGSK